MESIAVQSKRLIVNGVAYHYAVAGNGQPLLLLHGFPQDWSEWKMLIPQLALRFKVVAPNLRGIGGAPGPATGYDKHSMAREIKEIADLEFRGSPAIICGHDMGAYVAFAYALQFRAATASIITIDAPLPGTNAMEQVWANPRAWHIAFHANPDVAQMLISGRERDYFSYFIRSRIFNFAAITSEDIDAYAESYRTPGALRAALEMYSELLNDKDLNLSAIEKNGKLGMSYTALGSSATTSTQILQAMVDEVSTNGKAIVVDRTGHWIPEERPDAVLQAINDIASN